MAIWAKNILTKKGAFNRRFHLKFGLKINKIQRAEVAQSVEQGTENPRVGSSILSLGTSFKKEAQHFAVLPFFSLILNNATEISRPCFYNRNAKTIPPFGMNLIHHKNKNNFINE